MTAAATQPAPGRIVVVGAGMAAARFVAELYAKPPATPLAVTVFGDETHPAYNRILLADVLSGRFAAGMIRLPNRDDEVTVRRGVTVTAINRDDRTVTASDGSVTPYDTLVLATGSSPVLPPMRGVLDAHGELKSGVFSFRTMADCLALRAAAAESTRAVVVGGGLLGVSAARALAQLGLPVEIVHQAPHLMEHHLDPQAGSALHRTLDALNVTTYLECRARSVPGADAATGVELADGYTLECDLVVLACGVRPRVRLAREAGLTVETGIVVDDALRSVTDPAVYAIGDCAQHRGVSYGLVTPAWEQATVLAHRLGGHDGAATYAGSRVVTRLSTGGIDVASFGDVHASGREVDVIQFGNQARGSYQKVVIRDEKVVGGILVGELGTVGTLTLAYERDEELPPERLHLIATAAAPASPNVRAVPEGAL